MRREDFLARLRPVRADGARIGALPQPSYGGVEESDFRRRWEALSGEVHSCAPDELAATVDAVAGGRGPRLVGADPLVHALSADLRWPQCGIAGAATAGVAVVGAVAAIAATASVVLDSRVARGRSAALLAPVAVFVVRRRDLVATPSEVLRRVAERWPDGLPSQLVLVSGPSRSADIEMTLTRGVHGPGEVHVVFVDGPA